MSADEIFLDTGTNIHLHELLIWHSVVLLCFVDYFGGVGTVNDASLVIVNLDFEQAIILLDQAGRFGREL